MVESKVNLNNKDKKGETILHLVCRFGFKGIAKKLISYGADIYVSNNNNENCFITCCKYNKIDLAKFLLSYGVDFNCIN